MNEITRFDLDMDGSMEPSEHGRWVRYKDAQRPWVGLTSEEIYACDEECNIPQYDITNADLQSFAKAIEAKLKEKNNAA